MHMLCYAMRSTMSIFPTKMFLYPCEQSVLESIKRRFIKSGLDELRGITPCGDGRGATPRRAAAETTNPNCVFTVKTTSTGKELIGTDDKGRVVDYYSFYSDGTPGMREVCEYDNNDRVIKRYLDNRNSDESDESDERMYSADGKFDSITHYEYDSNGNITTMKFDNNADGTVDCVDHIEYDDSNREVKRTTLNNNGEIIGFTQTMYNDDGTRTVLHDSNGDGTFDSLNTYDY